MIENAPLLSAVVDPKSVVPLNSFTVLPASALPVIVGVVSLVVVAAVVNDDGVLGISLSILILLKNNEPFCPGSGRYVFTGLPLISLIVEPFSLKE